MLENTESNKVDDNPNKLCKDANCVRCYHYYLGLVIF